MYVCIWYFQDKDCKHLEVSLPQPFTLIITPNHVCMLVEMKASLSSLRVLDWQTKSGLFPPCNALTPGACSLRSCGLIASVKVR